MGIRGKRFASLVEFDLRGAQKVDWPQHTEGVG